jgi:hypothetical protein
VHDASPPQIKTHPPKGYVKVVNAKWEPVPEGGYMRWVEEEIKECCVRDVGWMKVWYQIVMVGMYWILGYDAWDLEYKRPPKVKDIDLY